MFTMTTIFKIHTTKKIARQICCGISALIIFLRSRPPVTSRLDERQVLTGLSTGGRLTYLTDFPQIGELLDNLSKVIKLFCT